MKFPGTGEKAFLKWSAGICTCCAIWVLSVAFLWNAQAMQAPGTRSSSSIHAATKAARPARRRKRRAVASKEKTPKPESPSDAAARPATVNLKNGKLTIEANNSDLAQILQDIAGISGMKIDGLTRSTRIFGVYGPGNPSDVLSKLLAGSGYNFIMADNTGDGAPRELLLTAQSSSSPAPTSASPHASAETNTSPSAALLGTEDPEARAERQQQNLRRLEQMHEEQQQQNTPQ